MQWKVLLKHKCYCEVPEQCEVMIILNYSTACEQLLFFYYCSDLIVIVILMYYFSVRFNYFHFIFKSNIISKTSQIGQIQLFDVISFNYNQLYFVIQIFYCKLVRSLYIPCLIVSYGNIIIQCSSIVLRYKLTTEPLCKHEAMINQHQHSFHFFHQSESD